MTSPAMTTRTGTPMPDFVPTHRLTEEASLKMIEAGVAKANELGCKVAIAVVDASCRMVGFLLMDGAKHFAITEAAHRLCAGGKRAQHGGAHGRFHQHPRRLSHRRARPGGRRGGGRR